VRQHSSSPIPTPHYFEQRTYLNHHARQQVRRVVHLLGQLQHALPRPVPLAVEGQPPPVLARRRLDPPHELLMPDAQQALQWDAPPLRLLRRGQGVLWRWQWRWWSRSRLSLLLLLLLLLMLLLPVLLLQLCWWRRLAAFGGGSSLCWGRHGWLLIEGLDAWSDVSFKACVMGRTAAAGWVWWWENRRLLRVARCRCCSLLFSSSATHGPMCVVFPRFHGAQGEMD